MKILITGGCGFIGVNLVRHILQGTAHQVVNLDNLTYAANPRSLSDIVDCKRYRFIQADIANEEIIASVFEEVKPDAVVHLAAESHVDRSIQGPGLFVQTNIVGTYNLLAASHRHYQRLPEPGKRQFRFLHISTDEVYGSLGASGTFTEATRYDPHSPYAATKAAADHLVRAWFATYGLPTIVTNCSNNFGPYQFPEKLLPLMILKCLSEEPLPIYGSGLNVRDWLFVEDHVRALMTVLGQGSPGETYNIGGNNEHPNIDFVRTACRIMDELRPRPSGEPHASLISFVEDRPGHDFRYAIDASKIKRELDWSPQFEFEASLRSTVQWYLENPSWWLPLMED